MFPTPVDRAAAELEKHRTDRQRIEGKSIVLGQELDQLLAVSADQTLDLVLSEDEGQGNGQASVRVRVESVRAQLADLDTAHGAVIIRIQNAMIGLAKAKADELRARAKKQQEKLDRLTADHLKALKQVGDLEGSENFVQTYFNRMRGHIPMGPGIALGPVPAPAFDALTGEIHVKGREADAIEARGRDNAAGGRWSGETLEQLLAPCADAEQLPPLERSIRAWWETAAPAAAQNWANSPLGCEIGGEPDPLPARTLFTIVWRAGVLSVAECGYVHLEGRRPTSKDWMYAGSAATYARASAAVTRGIEVG